MVACAITCALTPAYAVRWHIGFYPTTLLEVAIVVTVAVFVWETIAAKQPVVWRTPFLIPVLLFILAGALDVVFAPNRTAALGLYRAYLLEPIAFAVVLINVVRSPRRAFLVFAGLMAAAVVAGLANSFVVLKGLLEHTYQVTETPPVVIYLTANAVALFVVPVVAIAGSLALHARRIEGATGFVVAILGVVITALSFSRGGYLALSVVVAGLALSHRRRLLLLGGAAACGVALFLIPPIGRRIVIETQNVYGNTVQSRLDLWSGTLRFLRDHPLFGAGLSGFQDRVTPYLPANFHASARFIDPHDILLNFWVETGILGVIAIAWIFVLGFRSSWQGWRHGSAGWRPYQLGILLALVAVVVHGLVDVPYFKNDLSLEFWTLIAITYAGRLWPETAAEPARTPPRSVPQPVPS